MIHVIKNIEPRKKPTEHGTKSTPNVRLYRVLLSGELSKGGRLEVVDLKPREVDVKPNEVPTEIVYPSGARLCPTYDAGSWNLVYYSADSTAKLDLSSLYPLNAVNWKLRLLEEGDRHAILLHDHRNELQILFSSDAPSGRKTSRALKNNEDQLICVLHEVGHIYSALNLPLILDAAAKDKLDEIPKELWVYAKFLRKVFFEQSKLNDDPLPSIEDVLKDYRFVIIRNFYDERVAWEYALCVRREYEVDLGFRKTAELFDFVESALRGYGFVFENPVTLQCLLTEWEKYVQFKKGERNFGGMFLG